METEIEVKEYVNRAESVFNQGSKTGRLAKQATRFLRANERKQRLEEIHRIESMLSNANRRESAMSGQSIAHARRHLGNLQYDMEQNSAPTDLKPETRDAIRRRADELLNEIRPCLLTQEEMRRNPAGAVDRYRAGEGSRAMKAKILAWKNLMILANPDSPEQDLCNLEKFRPTMNLSSNGTFMANAQIPGQFTNHSVPDENWERTFGSTVNENSPLAAAEKRELEELRAMKAELDAKRAAKAAAFKERMAKGRQKAASKE